jgi:GNAT superfamily N-acetyltransferase
MLSEPFVLCELSSSDYPTILALWQRAGLHIRPEGRDAPAAFACQLASGSQRAIGLVQDSGRAGAADAAGPVAASGQATGTGSGGATGVIAASGVIAGGSPGLVAVALLTHDGRKGWINRLAVDPACRRRGLAARLVGEAERWFCQELGLEVWAALIEAGNEASLALFAQLGYQPADVVYVSKRTHPGA